MNQGKRGLLDRLVNKLIPKEVIRLNTTMENKIFIVLDVERECMEEKIKKMIDERND